MLASALNSISRDSISHLRVLSLYTITVVKVAFASVSSPIVLEPFEASPMSHLIKSPRNSPPAPFKLVIVALALSKSYSTLKSNFGVTGISFVDLNIPQLSGNGTLSLDIL